MKLALTLIVLFGTSCMSLFAQIVDPDRIRFGRVSEEECALAVYEPDPEAAAVVLYDYANIRLDVDRGEGGWQVVTDRHTRIKVLAAAGLEQGNITIPLEHSSSGLDESLFNLKATTFVLENGEIVEYDLSKDDYFIEEVSDDLDYYKIAMPGLREGAVIDIKYTIHSDFFWNLSSWWFQDEIPIDYSELEVEIPEYFLYNLEFKGYASHTLTLNDRTDGQRTVTFGVGENYNMRTQKYHWVARQVPAFRPEAYAPALRNFLFRVEFELASVNFPGQMGRNFNTTWEELTDRLRNASDFGGRLNEARQVEELAATLTAGLNSGPEKVAALYEGLKQRVSWNERYNIFANHNARQTMDAGSGNSAEINFALINLARAAGLEAYPVLVSTRSHGYLSLTRPSLSQFNHLIAAIQPEPEQWILLDATRGDVPLPLLPEACLNGRGRIVGEEFSDWIDILPQAGNKRVIQLTLNLGEDGALTGEGKMRHEDYAAVQLRRALAADADAFWQAWSNEYPAFQFSDFQVEHQEDIYEDMSSTFRVEARDVVMDGGELLYCPAILLWQLEENPFQAETREYPVDFVYPLEQTYVLQLNLPEGYVVEELPENGNFALPAGAGRYTFTVRETGEGLMIISKLSIKEPIFVGAEYYRSLREFFSIVVGQEESQIVLRKTS
ncbi:MAG: DUF3857 and transglutaminase domain-containing protein [Lewinella sp.]|nr:DUF3857 and transglutaminase domain-containing protein [Lewinella sp.]